MNTNEARRIRTLYAERDRTHKSNEGNPGRERMLRERGDTMERMLGDRLERPLCEFRVLDIGCGKGNQPGWFYEKGGPPENLFEIDLSPDRISVARDAYPAFTFVEGSAEELAFPDGSFDCLLSLPWLSGTTCAILTPGILV